MLLMLGWLALQDTTPVIKAAIGQLPDGKTHVEMSCAGAPPLFSAAMRPRADGTLGSSVFASVPEFAAVIKGGVSNYGASLDPSQLTKVDFYTEDVSYEPLDTALDCSDLMDEFRSGAVPALDSAARAKCVKDVSAYRGLRSTGQSRLWTALPEIGLNLLLLSQEHAPGTPTSSVVSHSPIS